MARGEADPVLELLGGLRGDGLSEPQNCIGWQLFCSKKTAIELAETLGQDDVRLEVREP